MSLTHRSVHIPKDPAKFEFDEEVAECFDDMANRSIPMYQESHRICSAIANEVLSDRIDRYGCASVIDIGASTGAFLKGIWDIRRHAYDTHIKGLVAIAVDSSMPMMTKLHDSIPSVQSQVLDVLDLDPGVYPHRFDVINVSYLVQFLNPDARWMFWKHMERMLAPDGILFVSTKDAIDGDKLRRFFDSEYIRFRKRMGYSEQEIQAKTAALKGSMFTELHHDLRMTMAQVGLGQQQEITRWLHFCTIAAQKTGHSDD